MSFIIKIYFYRGIFSHSDENPKLNNIYLIDFPKVQRKIYDLEFGKHSCARYYSNISSKTMIDSTAHSSSSLCNEDNRQGNKNKILKDNSVATSKDVLGIQTCKF